MTPQPTWSAANWRMLMVGVIGVSLLIITMTGVLAGLNAVTSNASPQNVNSGTLKLSMSAANPSAGFTSSISRLAPGDVVNRYIDLTNTGTLASQGLTLGIGATGTSTLISDTGSARALRVAVFSCPVAWTQGSAVCSSGSITEITPKALSEYASPQTLTTSTLAAETGLLHLRVQVALPDQDETTVDGVLPATTVQGGSVNVTYTFTQTQRTSQSTNS